MHLDFQRQVAWKPRVSQYLETRDKLSPLSVRIYSVGPGDIGARANAIPVLFPPNVHSGPLSAANLRPTSAHAPVAEASRKTADSSVTLEPQQMIVGWLPPLAAVVNTSSIILSLRVAADASWPASA